MRECTSGFKRNTNVTSLLKKENLREEILSCRQEFCYVKAETTSELFRSDKHSWSQSRHLRSSSSFCIKTRKHCPKCCRTPSFPVPPKLHHHPLHKGPRPLQHPPLPAFIPRDGATASGGVSRSSPVPRSCPSALAGPSPAYFLHFTGLGQRG